VVLIAVLVGILAALVVLAAGFAMAARRERVVERVLTPQLQARLSEADAKAVLSALVLDALASGVVVVDRDERVVLVNPAARAMGVLQADRLAFAELTELVRTATRQGATVNCGIDLPLGRLGREPIAMAATAVPLPDPRDPSRVSSVALLLDDVTESRRLEAVRRDFVANVSHELKTPVGALTLLAEAVQDAADDPEAVQRFAGRMQHEGVRLARLVRELLELSRLQGAEPLPGAVEVFVDEILDEAQDRTRLIAQQEGIAVITRCDSELLVHGNANQLVTALVNLIDNAIAYSPSGTRVAVHARAVSEVDQDWIEISVSDQGIGISEDDLARVFERFYRVDPARSRATGGTGLGLAIVKHVATNHGGTVGVWSVEGEGSTFTMRLPTVHRRAQSSESVVAGAPNGLLPGQSAISPTQLPSMLKGIG
jgi:two-component system, OmpR family, sensor histidine kinase SenX3